MLEYTYSDFIFGTSKNNKDLIESLVNQKIYLKIQKMVQNRKDRLGISSTKPKQRALFVTH